MAENSNIQWTDHTFNPWIGCTMISPGCENCYAAAQDAFRKWTPAGWGKGKPRKRTKTWDQPRKWNALAAKSVLRDDWHRPRVFCASLADWLDAEVPIEWLADLLTLIHETPNLDWLLLTKRPANWQQRITAAADFLAGKLYSEIAVPMRLRGWLKGTPLPNVWIGTTTEDQTRADQRIPHLLRIPAKVRFLSCEPLLGPVLLDDALNHPLGGISRADGIDWVICGGESGPKARPMQIEWAHWLRHECRLGGLAFFTKQLGGTKSHRGELADFPEDLRLREFPS